MEDKLDEILISEDPEKSKVEFLEKSHQTITDHINNYGVQDPLALTNPASI